jgi:hypothetical protein
MTPNLFVISPCFLENIDDRLNIHYKVLYLFTEHDYLNVAIDKSNKLLNKYEEIAIQRNDQIIIGWLKLMTKIPESFKRIVEIKEKINDNKDVCLYVCKHINNRKKPIIVFDRQDYTCYTFDENNEIEYDGHLIWFINWNEMEDVLKKPEHVNYGTQISGDAPGTKIKNVIQK